MCVCVVCVCACVCVCVCMCVCAVMNLTANVSSINLERHDGSSRAAPVLISSHIYTQFNKHEITVYLELLWVKKILRIGSILGRNLWWIVHYAYQLIYARARSSWKKTWKAAMPRNSRKFSPATVSGCTVLYNRVHIVSLESFDVHV